MKDGMSDLLCLGESPVETAEDYLRVIGDWKDPYPAPVIVEHEGVQVVRDDLLGLGSKVRSTDYLIGHDPKYAHVKEWVFGSCPATGYAQISLPGICSRYGKKAVLFMAKRDLNKLHSHQKRGLDLGAVYNWVPNGMLPVTQARAREYAAADPGSRALLLHWVGAPDCHRLSDPGRPILEREA